MVTKAGSRLFPSSQRWQQGDHDEPSSEIGNYVKTGVRVEVEPLSAADQSAKDWR
jgi:hypothetical protein